MSDAQYLPPLRENCRLSIVIPAKNEADFLVDALTAFTRQKMIDESRLEAGCFEVIVFCNGCTDGTAEIARRFAALHPAVVTHVVEAAAHFGMNVGTARGAALDLAVDRFLTARRPQGIVATTDADTVVDSRWIAWTLRESTHADAVAGYVRVSANERDAMLAPLRRLYDRELAYRRLLGDIEDRFDPQWHDPRPRHDSLVGASFAVNAAAYVAAGRLPRLPYHEDVAFAQALDRIDARIRHSYAVRAVTSARSEARVQGGFGSFIAELERKGSAHTSFLVTSAKGSIESARARHMLRLAWRGEEERATFTGACDLLGIDEATVRAHAHCASTFGELWLTVRVDARQSLYSQEPVEYAIAALRSALADCKASIPTRANALSGAG